MIRSILPEICLVVIIVAILYGSMDGLGMWLGMVIR